jgi:hypothetical protein
MAPEVAAPRGAITPLDGETVEEYLARRKEESSQKDAALLGLLGKIHDRVIAGHAYCDANPGNTRAIEKLSKLIDREAALFEVIQQFRHEQFRWCLWALPEGFTWGGGYTLVKVVADLDQYADEEDFDMLMLPGEARFLLAEAGGYI